MSDLLERFWAKVDTFGECWLWTAAKTEKGYGRIDNLRAHRLSAMIHFGMFDRRTLVLHHCDTPACVRPEHLYLGDAARNSRDMVERGRVNPWNSRKTHCKRGHVFDENTYITADGRRSCRTCKAIWVAEKRKRCGRGH